MRRFFVQRVDRRWDEVDEFVFTHRNEVITDGKERYNGGTIILGDDGQIAIGARLTATELQWVTRMLGVMPLSPDARITGGFCDEPSMLTLRIKGKAMIRDLKHGMTYKAVA